MDVTWLGHPADFKPSEMAAIESIKVGEHYFIRIGGAVYRKVLIRHGAGPIEKQMEVATGHIFDLTASSVYRCYVEYRIAAPAPTKEPHK